MPILDLVSKHEANLRRSINLVASENLVSSDVRRALACDVSMRYCIPPADERPAAIWDYPNQEHIRGISSETDRLARELFHAAYADSRPLSGNQVAQIILMTLASKGDTIWSVPDDCGGHFATPVIAAREGLKLIPLPYDRSKGIIDVAAAGRLARTHPPKLIFLDASMQLFPHPVADLRDAVGPSPIISYDASHTMGLIAGGTFQAPLLEGADLLHGSTHKTLWGPQKGLITTREDGPISARIREAVVPFFVSNIHVHHVAALGVALEESRDFGAVYAKQVITNAKALAAELSLHGMDVLFSELGGTESHQVLVDLDNKANSLAVWERLQSIGLNANAISLPFRHSYGLRLGVAEATRRGLGAQEMGAIARWIALCASGSSNLQKLTDEVAEMSSCFSTIGFSHCPTDLFTPVEH